ncbi:Retrovirus-related Pol polyprotein from transposon RE1-like protein [Drosera capensis]
MWSIVGGGSFSQLDVKNVFLHGHLTEEVYMRQPSDFIHPILSSHVYHLHKALYDLRQAPCAWFYRFSSFLLRSVFTQAKPDSSMFVFRRHSQVLILLLYVDDIVVIDSSHILLSSFISVLSFEFTMKDLENIHYFFMSQEKYILNLLLRLGFQYRFAQPSLLELPFPPPTVIGFGPLARRLYEFSTSFTSR